MCHPERNPGIKGALDAAILSLNTNHSRRGSRKRPDPPAGPPIDGSGQATSAQEEKRGASWPTGQRHTCSPGSVRRVAISLWQRCAPDPSRPRDGSGLLRPLPWIMTKTILAEAARLRSAVQTKSPLSWDSSEAHGEAGVISYRANIIALPYRAQPLASGNRLIGISKKAPLSAGLE